MCVHHVEHISWGEIHKTKIHNFTDSDLDVVLDYTILDQVQLHWFESQKYVQMLFTTLWGEVDIIFSYILVSNMCIEDFLETMV